MNQALQYLEAGLCVLPARLEAKRPDLPGWKEYQHRLPSEDDARRWFVKERPLCLVAGAVSGNLEMIDFDCRAEMFAPWLELVHGDMPGLAERLVIEQSPSGGRHVAYRCAAPVSENLKLAQRFMPTGSDQPVVLYGKTYQPRKVGGLLGVVLTYIETRGEGGLFLCAPSPGYELVQGDFTRLPVLSAAEREVLLEAAWSLNEFVSHAEPGTAGEPCGRPGDDYNERGDVRAVLHKHGWTLARSGDNEYWRRPGKTCGWSATLKNGVFYVFSSNAAPFELNKAYSRFSVYARLEHEGDYSRAASALRSEGYGNDGGMVDVASLASAFLPEDEPPSHDLEDPGPIPGDLLRVPGFVSEVMDHCLETAPYPNPVLAFCGALAFQAFLAGRKVRDQADNRSNIYLLGLAFSSVGKDWPRKINMHIAHQVGLSDCLGEDFASGEGIRDALFAKPCMMFQTDEIDGLLLSFNNARDARHENILRTLLTMYSSANSVVPMRPKARQGKEQPSGAIDQPCLVLYGTAIPTHYYGALSERLLTNGFFARMLIVESGPRCPGQEPHIRELPARILDTARWWTEFRPGDGNLDSWHPVPAVVTYASAAQRLLVESRAECEAEYAKAEARDDPVGTTVWGRVNEHSRKLALLYAVSANHQAAAIGLPAAEWATRFAMHQARRMLYMAGRHVSENPFDAKQKKVLRLIAAMPGGEISRTMLYNRTRYLSPREREEIVANLLQTGQIKPRNINTGTKPRLVYTVRSGESS